MCVKATRIFKVFSLFYINHHSFHYHCYWYTHKEKERKKKTQNHTHTFTKGVPKLTPFLSTANSLIGLDKIKFSMGKNSPIYNKLLKRTAIVLWHPIYHTLNRYKYLSCNLLKLDFILAKDLLTYICTARVQPVDHFRIVFLYVIY